MFKRISLAAAFIPAVLAADCFTGWPVDCRPSEVSRRITRQFLSTSPDYYLPKNGYRGNGGYGRGKEIQYSVVSLWVNALECARILGDAELEAKLIDAFTPYYGPKRGVLPKFKHVDFTIVGSVPLEIAILTGEKRARDLGLAYADQQWEEPKPDDPPPWYNKTPYETRLSWWKQGYTDQTRLWIDDAYMIAALQTQAYRVTGDRKYIDRTAKELCLYLDKLQLPNGLFHHAPGVPFVWGRGAGWMAAAMPMTLRYLPKDSEYRPRIMSGYRRMMATLLAKQREDGMWSQLVGERDSWAESSCTAMFAYAFAEGVKYGWLDAKKYGPAFRRAFLALVARMDEFGNVSNVCEGTGARNDRAYYLARRRVNGDSHGQAAMLWLCRSILEKAKGVTVTAQGTGSGSGLHLARPSDDARGSKPELLNRKADGFRGIWYFNQPSNDEYVYKYSGGLGTYCAGHIPMAVYAKEVDKTFFTFGGTDERNTTLMQSVSYFDHKTGKLARPTIVFNKHTTDAHDNAVINIDDKGYIYLFSSSHGRWRPSRIARSEKPYDISSFKEIWDGNFSYPQPFYVPGKGFLFLHAWYVAGRSNCLMTSNPDGSEWTDRMRLVYFNEGHYQRAWQFGYKKVGVAFDQHPKGKGLNWRTDLFYMETSDFGKTWQSASGETLKLPIASRDNPALAVPYAGKGRNVYIKGVKFDLEGRPIVLYTVSKGYRAGPADGPREWKLAKWTGSEWREIDTGIRSDNNYDFAELYVDSERDWRIIGASEKGPQPYNPGGEIAVWSSHDAGETWALEKRLTENSERNQNYPRQPLNVNPRFYAFWADGHGRKPSISRLYFCDRDLNVYRMPLKFEGDFATPEPYTPPAAAGKKEATELKNGVKVMHERTTDLICLSNRYGRIEVSLKGAQIRSYVPAGGSELLYRPSAMDFSGKTENRGGIPVCWPWFGRNGEPGTPSHGFARHSVFKVERTAELPDGSTELVLSLSPNDETRKAWPYEFGLEYRITLGQELKLVLETRNADTKPMLITEGVHPYWRVSDRAKVRVDGVEGLRYCFADETTVDDKVWKGPFVADGHFDHVFRLKGDPVTVCDTGAGRSITIRGTGYSKIVIWTPAAFKEGAFENLPPDDIFRFVCVEPATLFRPEGYTLIPGEKHVLEVSISSQPLK